MGKLGSYSGVVDKNLKNYDLSPMMIDVRVLYITPDDPCHPS